MKKQKEVLAPVTILEAKQWMGGEKCVSVPMTMYVADVRFDRYETVRFSDGSYQWVFFSPCGKELRLNN